MCLTGFVPRLILLLDNEATRPMAAQALVNVTRHGGLEVRYDLAKVTPGLTRILETYPDDSVTSEHLIITIEHCVGSVLTGNIGEDPIKTRILASIDMERTLKAVLRVLRNPGISFTLLAHASELLAHSTFKAAKECLAIPALIRFLVAGLRSMDWSHRCTALTGIIYLHARGSEVDSLIADPNKFSQAIQSGLPPHLSDLMAKYGPQHTTAYIRLKVQKDFQDAMMKARQDHDLFSLGVTLSQFIMLTDYSIIAGSFYFHEPDAGKWTADSGGLPFVMWTEALPYCAKALREKGELDKADILEIKYSFTKQQPERAGQLAKVALKRNSSVSYFHYAVSMNVDEVEGLRAAKKGLRCNDLTPFIRHQLLWRAVEHAAWIGQKHLADCGSETEARVWEEGIAFMLSALDDAKEYVETAPPDHTHRKDVLYWYIILTITVKGPEISPDLKELKVSLIDLILSRRLTHSWLEQGIFHQLKLTEEMARFFDSLNHPPPKTMIWHCVDNIRRFYSSGAAEWDSVIRLLDQQTTHPVPSKDKAADDLATWLENVHIEHGEHKMGSCDHGKPVRLSMDNVALYRCSWCSNPSAVLRKCSGCNSTR